MTSPPLSLQSSLQLRWLQRRRPVAARHHAGAIVPVRLERAPVAPLSAATRPAEIYEVRLYLPSSQQRQQSGIALRCFEEMNHFRSNSSLLPQPPSRERPTGDWRRAGVRGDGWRLSPVCSAAAAPAVPLSQLTPLWHHLTGKSSADRRCIVRCRRLLLQRNAFSLHHAIACCLT